MKAKRYTASHLDLIYSSKSELFLYILVGLVVGVLFLLIFFFALRANLDEWVASLSAYVITAPLSYVFHGRITFQRPLSKFTFLKFSISATALVIFSEATSLFFQENASTLGYVVICWCFVSVCNFMVYKFYVFR